MPKFWKPLSFALGLLAACAEFPDLDAAIARRGPVSGTPVLISIEPLLSETAGGVQNVQEQAVALAARVTRLRARARALQRPVISRRDRARMAVLLRQRGL